MYNRIISPLVLASMPSDRRLAQEATECSRCPVPGSLPPALLHPKSSPKFATDRKGGTNVSTNRGIGELPDQRGDGNNTTDSTTCFWHLSSLCSQQKERVSHAVEGWQECVRGIFFTQWGQDFQSVSSCLESQMGSPVVATLTTSLSFVWATLSHPCRKAIM